jgi:hypothetical protein
MSPTPSQAKVDRPKSLNSASSGKEEEDQEDEISKEDEAIVPSKESPVLEWIRAFWRCSTALIIMLWLYSPPNTPSAISCLSHGPEMSYVGMLSESPGYLIIPVKH